jgi:hypothetical protein
MSFFVSCLLLHPATAKTADPCDFFLTQVARGTGLKHALEPIEPFEESVLEF